jgi:cyclohexyl-isocyanide hydratase
MILRRDILKGIAAMSVAPSVPAESRLEIGLLLYPRLTQLDLTGPLEVLWRMSNARVHLLWKTREPVTSDRGLTLSPTMTLEECPALDVVVVPGGAGQVALMDDAAVLGFLVKQAATARYVASVCTGSLVLGAAGLLKGRRATCHWMALDELALLGATPVAERVVIDGPIVTGGGVTAGIDFGLTLVANLRGIAEAKRIQLEIEYNPQPPFQAGSPGSAGPELVAAARKRLGPFLEARHEATLRAKARLEGLPHER